MEEHERKGSLVENDEMCDEIEVKKRPVGVFELFKYTRGRERLLLFIGISAGFLSGVCIPISTILFGEVINELAYNSQNLSSMAVKLNLTEETIRNTTDGNNTEEAMNFFVLFLTILALILLLLNYLLITTFNYVAECQVFRLRTKYLECLLTKEIGWFDVHNTREFTSRFTEDLNKVQEGTGEKIGIYIFYISNAFLSLITALYYGWLLTLVTLVLLPLMAISMAVMSKVTSTFTTTEMDGYAKAGSIVEEVITLVRTVVAFEGHEKEVERYEKSLRGPQKSGIKRGWITAISSSLFSFLTFCGFALTFWYGTKLIIESDYPANLNDYNPRDLVIVFFSILFSAMSVGQASPFFQAFNVARGAATEVFKILQEPSHEEDNKGMIINEMKGKIEFEHIQFSYPSRPNVVVLKDVNLQINPGETLAIVGSSGSGKSTCLQLLLRFYEPINGVITLDGYDIRSLDMNWLRDNIGIVSQEPILFAMTIAENIRMGRESATFEEIKESAKQANAHNFIMNFPNGYDTVLGDSGAQISGGQKQRIAIARVILKNPKILLLDEATSSIDSSNEAVIQETLEEVKKNRTTIIVSHRLSAIQSADMIIVMKDGSIIQQGTHADFNDKYNTNTGERRKGDLQYYGKEEMASNGGIKFVKEIEENLKKEDTIVDMGAIELFAKETKETGESKHSMSELMAYNKSEWGYILLGTLAAFVNGLSFTAYAVVFGDALENLAIKDPEEAQENADMQAIYFLIIGVATALSEFIQITMFTISGEILTKRLRKETFKAILYQEMGWFDRVENTIGAICSRLSLDASNVQGATGIRIGLLVKSASALGTAFIVSILLNYKLGLIISPTIPILIIIMYYQTKISSGQSVTETDTLKTAGQIASEAIVNIKTVASYRKEHYFANKFNGVLQGAHLASLKKSHMRGFLFGAAQCLPLLQYAVLMIYGVHLIETEGMEYGVIFKVGEALLFSAMMIAQSLAFAPSVSKAKISAQRILHILKRRPTIESDPSVGLCLNKEITNIHMDKVEFSYPNRSSIKVFDDLNMNINRGQTIALVGSSGCGKSTIISILLRYYDITGGSVKLNGIDINNLNVNSIRKHFGLVSQEPVLFNSTLAENIAYGDNSRLVTIEEITKAAKDANIHSFIHSLPDGYNTMAGDKGTQLSGGQKQRIAIARALLRNPDILLLDEATSALDSENERIVQNTIESVQRGRTNIVVTHRLKSIQNSDTIFVIKGAKVVECGTHNELMELKGEYYFLCGTS